MRHVRSSSFSHELLLLMKLLPLYEERKDPTVDIATNIYNNNSEARVFSAIKLSTHMSSFFTYNLRNTTGWFGGE